MGSHLIRLGGQGTSVLSWSFVGWEDQGDLSLGLIGLGVRGTTSILSWGLAGWEGQGDLSPVLRSPWIGGPGGPQSYLGVSLDGSVRGTSAPSLGLIGMGGQGALSPVLESYWMRGPGGPQLHPGGSLVWRILAALRTQHLCGSLLLPVYPWRPSGSFQKITCNPSCGSSFLLSMCFCLRELPASP